MDFGHRGVDISCLNVSKQTDGDEGTDEVIFFMEGVIGIWLRTRPSTRLPESRAGGQEQGQGHRPNRQIKHLRSGEGVWPALTPKRQSLWTDRSVGQ